jgi:hypothetical protein
LKVSRETDEALRAYLGQTGGRKGDLSRFVQEAVQARLQKTLLAPAKTKESATHARRGFAKALKEVRARARALTQARVEGLVEEAVAYARKRR